MKRTWTIALLVIFGLAAAGFCLTPVIRLRLEENRRQEAEALYEKTAPHLVLDAKTQAILSGADRVETFRLAGGDFDEQAMPTGSKMHPQAFGDYTVLYAGPPQGTAFAVPLRAAVAQATADRDAYQCFDPVVGLQVWKGKTHAEICVCFFCSGIEITTKDARNHIVYQTRTNLGAARPAFLALSRQAFPEDKTLAELK